MSAASDFLAPAASPARAPRVTGRPALLVAELRGTGDIAILIPFLQSALTRYDVTLLAPPNAAGLIRRFAPDVELIPCVAPWALFSGPSVHHWPWPRLFGLVRTLRARRFAAAASIWPIARDHVFLRLLRPQRLLGYGRGFAGRLLDDNLGGVGHVHRPEAWRCIAARLGLPPWPLHRPRLRPAASPRRLVLHSGASQPLRVWPLPRYAELLRHVRAQGWEPLVLCDAPQLAAWRELEETSARTVTSMDDLIDTIASGAAFLGNDSGPGHIAALCGVPTFTLFGPQVPELFAPDHPQAAWIEGLPCPHKPCFDHCRYAEPFCLTSIGPDQVWPRLATWLQALEPKLESGSTRQI